jgi:hypothetical protein
MATSNPSELVVLNEIELDHVAGGLGGVVVKDPEPHPVPMPTEPVRPGDYL